MGGCSWFLPSVPDEVTNSVSGEGVRIVARETDTNPTEEWIYTFLLLEVTEPGQRLEIVAEALRTNGWEVRESPGPNVLLVAIKPSVADLTLVALETFLEPSPITSVQRRFAGFPQDSDKGYFVALIMPLGE
jgi:hypothetical protein